MGVNSPRAPLSYVLLLGLESWRGDGFVNVKTQVAFLLFLIGMGGSALAQSDSQTEVPRGLWQTEVDRNGIVYHVRTRRCGRALCGRVERVTNRKGYDTPSNAVGQKVLWDLRPQPDGSFFGEVRGTQGEQFLDSRVEVAGQTLRVKICTQAGCDTMTWQRLR